MRSYNACLRDVVGVCKTEAVSRPRGVEGSEGRSSVETLDEVGVRRLRMRGVRSAREDGVEGNRIVPFSGEIAGIGKPRLVGDLEGDEGVMGRRSLLDKDRDLGDMEANTRVKDEGFEGDVRTGRSASGTTGTTGRLECI